MCEATSTDRGGAVGGRQQPGTSRDGSAGAESQPSLGRGESAGDRGQTPIDFVVAMGLFLTVLAVTVWFLPGLLAPTTGASDHSTVTDRSVTRIAGPLLGVPGTPSTLNGTCTVAFFGGPGGSACPFNPSDPVADRVGLSSGYQLNVTVERNVTGGPEREVLCMDAGGLGACTGSGTRLATGPAPPADGGSTTTAYRVVALENRTVRLNVRVWR